jgi:hypothetical protein
MAAGSRELQLFERFYQRCETGFWCYRSSQTRWALGTGEEAALPTFGFDSNTFVGNSGSAVMLVRSPMVAGLLFGGRLDFDEVKPFAFDRHEGALPSRDVRGWLRAAGILD